jgi:hypothetical protein
VDNKFFEINPVNKKFFFPCKQVMSQEQIAKQANFNFYNTLIYCNAIGECLHSKSLKLHIMKDIKIATRPLVNLKKQYQTQCTGYQFL